MNILRIRDVIAQTGLKRRTVYNLVSRGDFPRPIQLTSRAVGWLDTDVSNWLNDRVEERDCCSNLNSDGAGFE